MSSNNTFYHSLIIREDVCIGCTHCMRSCPTGALRISDGLAKLTAEKCVDCGYCFKVCPVRAIEISDDDFDDIFKYENRVALVPAVFLSQFDSKYTLGTLYAALKTIGFTHIFETESTVEFLLKISREKTLNKEGERKFISSFCPAIVRLIQIRFPALLKHLIDFKAPLKLSASFVKETFADQSDKDSTGIFYITPCAAKIAEVKAEKNESDITGVINMNSMYNRMMSILSKLPPSEIDFSSEPFNLTKRSVTYTLTHGEADAFDGRCLAVDEIHNVIEILEKIENEEIKIPDFLELRACDESCAGGVLTIENRFLAAERLFDRSEQSKYFSRNIAKLQETIFEKYDFLLNKAQCEPFKAETVFKFADDYELAMKKYNIFRQINKTLPQVDCGICGSPSCQDFAEDVTRQIKDLNHCVFIQRSHEKKNHLGDDNNIKFFAQIWGEDKLNVKNDKNES